MPFGAATFNKLVMKQKKALPFPGTQAPSTAPAVLAHINPSL